MIYQLLKVTYVQLLYFRPFLPPDLLLLALSHQCLVRTHCNCSTLVINWLIHHHGISLCVSALLAVWSEVSVGPLFLWFSLHGFLFHPHSSVGTPLEPLCRVLQCTAGHALLVILCLLIEISASAGRSPAGQRHRLQSGASSGVILHIQSPMGADLSLFCCFLAASRSLSSLLLFQCFIFVIFLRGRNRRTELSSADSFPRCLQGWTGQSCG